MASSTFAVSSTSETVVDKDIDLELDPCDENGMSTNLDVEVSKDHTYTKEPDVSEVSASSLENELREILDSSNQLDEMFNNVSSQNSRPSRTSRSSKVVKKAPVKPKPKKSEPAKKKTVSQRNKAKQEEETVKEIPALEDITANGEETSKEKVEEQSKPAKRGSKRKIEEKENVLKQSTEESAADEPEKDSPAPKRQATRIKKSSKAEKSPKKKVATDAIIDTANLPKGWQRHIVVRKSGKSAGQCDVYYYSPDGSKFRSKPDIAAYLMRTKLNLKLDLFDFSKKKMISDAPATPQKKLAAPKPKTPSPKKPSTPKKSPKLLVKIVSAKSKKKGRKGSKGAKKK